MRTIRNFALVMLILWIFQLGFNVCANSVKNFILKNVTIFYEDKSEHILEAHKAAYGAIGLLAAKKHGKSLRGGWEKGVFAGEIAYFGKKIARKRGFGFFGKVIHSLGVSMLENQILNKPPFSRYKIFLPPVSLEFDIQEGFGCQFLSGSLVGILFNLVGVKNANEHSEAYLFLLLRTFQGRSEYLVKAFFSDPESSQKNYQGECYKPLDSLLAGTPVFVFNKSFGSDGYNFGGIITTKEDFEPLSHEMIHSCQYREMGIANLFIERNIFRDSPILFSQDLLCLLLWDFSEEEPKEYDAIYDK